MRGISSCLLAVTLTAVLAGLSRAGPAYPNTTVEFIAPANPGGGWDLTCRLVAKVLQEERLVSQPIVVTNMPGASGAVAIAHAVTRRRGDAHTLIVFSPSLTLAMVAGRTPYSYGDVTPIAALTTDYGVVVVRKHSAINTLRTMLEVIRRNPEALVVAGGSTPGGTDHVMLARLIKAAGGDPLKVRYLPFLGGGDAMTALLGGFASALITSASEAVVQAEADQVRVLAVLSENRLDGLFRNVPTAIEQGYHVTFPIWRGFYGPPDMPAGAVKFWEDTLVKMTRTKAWAKVLEERNWSPLVLTGERFRRFLDQDTKSFDTLLRELGFVR